MSKLVLVPHLTRPFFLFTIKFENERRSITLVFSHVKLVFKKSGSSQYELVH
jgi:hypothetical protein